MQRERVFLAGKKRCARILRFLTTVDSSIARGLWHCRELCLVGSETGEDLDRFPRRLLQIVLLYKFF